MRRRGTERVRGSGACSESGGYGSTTTGVVQRPHIVVRSLPTLADVQIVSPLSHSRAIEEGLSSSYIIYMCRLRFLHSSHPFPIQQLAFGHLGVGSPLLAVGRPSVLWMFCRRARKLPVSTSRTMVPLCVGRFMGACHHLGSVDYGSHAWMMLEDGVEPLPTVVARDPTPRVCSFFGGRRKPEEAG